MKKAFQREGGNHLYQLLIKSQDKNRKLTNGSSNKKATDDHRKINFGEARRERSIVKEDSERMEVK